MNRCLLQIRSACRSLGHKVRLDVGRSKVKESPQSQSRYNHERVCSVTVNIDGEEVRYFHAVKEGVDRVFVDHPWFLAKVIFAASTHHP